MSAGPTRLNIGASQTYIPDWCNIDIAPWADVRVNLGQDRMPFPDDSVDVVFSYWTLEHVPNYLAALEDIWRVLRHGGRLLVGLPYVSSTEYHLVNPYHLHNFNEYSFDFFELGKLKGSATEENPILLTKVFHRFTYFSPFDQLPEEMQWWCRRHLMNVVRFIDFGLYAVKPPHTHIEVGPVDADLLRAEFDACLAARRGYPRES